MKLKPFQRIVMTLASVIVVFSLIVPDVANAILLDDLTGIMENALEASDDITSPLLSITPKMIQYYLVSIVCLTAATRTLEWIIANPDWIDLGGTMVTKGWDLTRGLANMFLLLIFLAVAFGFILRIESIEAPRALPRLIIIALLLNFSKLFVGMLVDIATIANNTIIYGHEELLWKVMEGFLNGLYSTFVLMLMSVVKSVLASAIPLAALPKLLISISSLLWKGLFISYMPIWIFQIVAASALTLIFCIYIILFAARVYIIQILAILSPLAFLCLILPQTQKFWDEWLKHLVQWTFVGTILLFFLMIGLSAGNAILPNAHVLPNATTLGNYIPILNIPQYYLFYSFLFIYLAVSFWMVDRTMPLLAVAIVNMSKGVATKSWDKYGKGVKNDLVQRINEKAVAHENRGREISEGNITLSDKEKLVHQATSVALAPVFGAHRLNRTTPKQSVIKYQSAARERLEKLYGKDDDGVDRFTEVINANPKILGQMGASERVGALQYGLAHKGTEFVQNLRQKGVLHETLRDAAPYSMSTVIKAVGYDPASTQGEEGKKIADLIAKKDSKGKANFDLAKYVHGDIGEDALNQKAAIYTGAAKIMEKKDSSDNWDKGVFKINPNDTPENQQATRDLQEGIAFKANSGQIRNIGDKHGQDVLDNIQSEIVEKDYGKFAVANPKLASAQAINSGTQEVFPAPENIAYARDPQTGMIKKRKKETQQEVIRNIIEEEHSRRSGGGQAAGGAATGGGRQRRTGPGQQHWGGGGGTTPPSGGPGGGGGGAAPGPTPGPGQGGGTGGAATGGGRQRRTDTQSNIGDIGRNRTAGRQTDTRPDTRNRTDETFLREQNIRESDTAARPDRDLREVNRDGSPRSGTTPSGRTSGIYPDDINPPSRRGRVLPPDSA
jgi:hypothetical protein